MTDSPPIHPRPQDPWSYPTEPPVAPPPEAAYGYGYGYGYGDGPVPPWSPSEPPLRELPPKVRWMAFDPDKALPRWGMPDIVLGLLLWIAGTLAVAIPVSLATKDTAIIGLAGLVGSWVGMAGYVVWVARFKGQGSVVGDFGFRFRWFDPLIGLAAGVGTILLVSVVVTAVASLFDAPPGSNADEVFKPGSSLTMVFVTAAMASIGAPLVEELFFRGLVLRAIAKRLGSVAGIIGSTGLFAIMHWPGGETGSAVSLVCGIAVMGLVFALLARGLRRLGPSICTHMTINGLASAVQIVDALKK